MEQHPDLKAYRYADVSQIKVSPTNIVLPESPEYSNFNEFIRYLESQDYAKRLTIIKELKGFPPRFFYKFRPLNDELAADRLRDLLVHSRLWLSSPDDFNDPFDMSAKLIFDGTTEEKKQRVDGLLKRQGVKWSERQKKLPLILPMINSEHDEALQRSYLKTASAVGVYCFAGDPLNILMWSHYSRDHSGVCIQFDVAADPGVLMRIVRMKYRDEYTVLKWTTGFKEGLQTLLETKHIGWAYEKESRVVVLKAAHQHLLFRPSAITGIILGCRADEGVVESLQQILNERAAHGYPIPKLYRAFKDLSRYRLKLRIEIL